MTNLASTVVTFVICGILSHSSQKLSKSCRFLACCLPQHKAFSSLHTSSRTEVWRLASQSLILTCFFFRHSFVALVVWFGSLSCYNTKSTLIIGVLVEGLLIQEFTIHTFVLGCGLIFFGSHTSISLSPQWVKLTLKRSILVPSDHSTFSQAYSLLCDVL